MNQISSQAVDFDIETEQPQANDLLTAVRQTSSGAYVGVTIKWDDVARIATEVANRAAERAEQAETDANNILERVQSKGTEITNFVATSKTEIETQKNESVNAVKSVYQTDLNELKGDLSKLKNDNSNLFDFRTITENKVLNRGTEFDNTNYFLTDYIEVKPLTVYSVLTGASEICNLFNADKNYIGVCKKTDMAQPNDYCIFKTNATTKYIRFNGFYPFINPTKCMLFEGEYMPSEYIPFNQKIVNYEYNNFQNYLFGKTLMTIGDSITFGYSADTDEETGYKKNYGYIVAKRNHMNYINRGWSGSTIQDCQGYGSNKPFIRKNTIYANFGDDGKGLTKNEPDIITVWFGWNDYAKWNEYKDSGDENAPKLGNIDDDIDTSYYGAWNKAMNELITRYPNVKIGVIVPYGMDAEWRQAVRNIAIKWGVPYLDMVGNQAPIIYDTENGLSTEQANIRRQKYLADGTHPNQKGYDYIANYYEDFLRRI